MNIWWQAETRMAQSYSSLLNVDRESHSINDKVLYYITPPYKYYIKSIVENKGVIKEDLERIEERTDLSADQKKLAIKIYWLVHIHFPLLYSKYKASACENWDPIQTKQKFPAPFENRADSKPLLLWYDNYININIIY